MKGKLLRFRVRFEYLINNPMDYYAEILIGFRFSLWKKEDNFTTSEIVEIKDSSTIKPGETVILIIKTISSEVSNQMKTSDKMFCGVPFNKIGNIEILERLEDEIFHIPS